METSRGTRPGDVTQMLARQRGEVARMLPWQMNVHRDASALQSTRPGCYGQRPHQT